MMIYLNKCRQKVCYFSTVQWRKKLEDKNLREGYILIFFPRLDQVISKHWFTELCSCGNLYWSWRSYFVTEICTVLCFKTFSIFLNLGKNIWNGIVSNSFNYDYNIHFESNLIFKLNNFNYGLLTKIKHPGYLSFVAFIYLKQETKCRWIR